MDKKIEKSDMKNNTKWILAVVAVIAIFLWFINSINDSLRGPSSGGQQQNLSLRSLILSTVTKGRFDDYLYVQGIVSPKSTVYLDAIAGGRVEERFVQQGEYVKQGQSLVRMSNTSLQLDVISREAQISEQLNFLRNTQMQAETNRLDLLQSLLDTDNIIRHLARKLRQSERLLKHGSISEEEFSGIAQDLEYNKKRRALTLERQTQEDKVRSLQIEQLEDSAQMLNKNLKFARDNISNLLVKAPVSGYLSDFSVELGESKIQGYRLGQIDIPGQFKVVASLDEYYLNKISLGMNVHVKIKGQKQILTISKIDSRVNNAQFQIEVDLPDILPNNDAELSVADQIKRGQTMAMDIVLSESTNETLMIERGAFINNTGGNWIFVLNTDTGTAYRRSITVGKKNQQFIEVINGLEEGDRVIISNYSAFDKADTLNF